MANYSLLLAKPVIGSLASSKPLTTTRSVSLFGPTETAAAVGRLSSRCFVSLKSTCRETDCEYNFNLKIHGPMEARPRFYEDDFSMRGHFINELCHRVSATRNLARLLNLMDSMKKKESELGHAPRGHPRWDVIQDTKALHLLYNMSGIPRKDANVDHKDIQGSKSDIFRQVRVLSNTKRMITRIILERIGPDPKAKSKLYSIRLHLQDCIVSDVKVDMESEVLKITIPKKEDKYLNFSTLFKVDTQQDVSVIKPINRRDEGQAPFKAFEPVVPVNLEVAAVKRNTDALSKSVWMVRGLIFLL